MDKQVLNITVPKKWEGQTIEDVFKRNWQAPKKLVHQLRMEKSVKISGRIVPWHTVLSDKDEITIVLPDENQPNMIPAHSALSILYEDDHILAVNKEAGQATHPNDPSGKHTLANAVAYYVKQKNPHVNARHVHRLDQHTTGVVLFAKHALAHAILDRMLAKKEMNRTYFALADGLIKKRKGTINKPIGRDRHHPTRRRISKTGQEAVTYYEVLKTSPNDDLTFIQCILDTGRTHQIRVHLKSIGHPLAGDRLYGGSNRFPRPALHAHKLSFIHPFTGELLTIEAPFNDRTPIFEPYI